jgi:trafficking protein particle complex subunit 9
MIYGHSQPESQQEEGRCGSSSTSQTIHSLEGEVRASRSQYRRAILHQLLIFDSMDAAQSASAPTDVFFVPAPERSRSTTIKTVMCDITAKVLHSMDDLAQQVQELSTIESPSLARSSRYAAKDIAARVRARMTMHGEFSQDSLDPAGSSSPATNGNVDRSTTPARARSASRHSVASPNRANRFSEVSAFGSRDASRERNSIMSSTVTTPTERKKSRSIGRSRIVVGALYLQAGLWPDAVKDMSEGTAIARSNNDYLWHAKGLEYIIACLLMFGWAEMYFQVSTGEPSITMLPLIYHRSLISAIQSQRNPLFPSHLQQPLALALQSLRHTEEAHRIVEPSHYTT